MYPRGMFIRFLRLTALALPLLGATACASAPAFSGMTADELFALGQREFEAGDWDEAAEVLDHLLLRVADPSFAHLAEARFMLAEAYMNGGEYLTAEVEFIRFVDSYPGHERAPEAALGACRSLEERSPIPERDQTATERAVVVCRNVVADYAGIVDDVADEAQQIVNRMRAKLAEKDYKNAMFYYDRQWWDSAVLYFEDVVEQYGDTEWAPSAIARMIEAYREVGYDEEVEQWRRTLLNSYPDSPEARAVVNGMSSDTSSLGGAATGAGTPSGNE